VILLDIEQHICDIHELIAGLKSKEADKKISEGIAFAEKFHSDYLKKYFYQLSGLKEILLREYDKAIPLLIKGDTRRELRSELGCYDSSISLCYLKTKRFEEYENHIKDTEAYIGKEYFEIKMEKIEWLFRTGIFEECKKEIIDVKLLFPKNTSLLFFDSLIRIYDGDSIDTKKWKKYCNKIISKYPWSTIHHFMLGLIHENAEEIEEAIKEYEVTKQLYDDGNEVNKTAFLDSLYRKRLRYCKSKLRKSKKLSLVGS
jgi:hypothetical protein